MSWMGRAVTLFPAIFFGLLLLCPVWLAVTGSAWPVAAFLAIGYLLPPVLYRIHGLFFPLHDGSMPLDEPGYVAWWGSHQLQLPYDAVPAFEAILRTVPGAYSMWLRLWGSKIGRSVHWTPSVEVIDRSRLIVGDRVVFGHRVGLYPHLIRIRKCGVWLLLLKIEIGDDVFVGAGSRLGPGAKVPPGSVVPLLTDVSVGKIFRPDGAGKPVP